MWFFVEMAERPSREDQLEMIKSLCFFRHMQYLQFFIHYHCDNCTHNCPGASS